MTTWHGRRRRDWLGRSPGQSLRLRTPCFAWAPAQAFLRCRCPASLERPGRAVRGTPVRRDNSPPDLCLSPAHPPDTRLIPVTTYFLSSTCYSLLSACILLAVNRTSSKLDELISACDDALRTVFGPPPRAKRASPAETVADVELDVHERELAARLMRVNHTGEVCAQALYQGQALTARLPEVRDKMEQAAAEENDHLAWTQARIDELGGHSSYLNVLWYAGSFTIGALAGLVGDKWSLGFVAAATGHSSYSGYHLFSEFYLLLIAECLYLISGEPHVIKTR